MQAAGLETSACEVAERSTRLTVVFCAWLVLMTTLGAGLRLHNLGTWSFWEDELFSISSISRDAPATAEERSNITTQWSKWLGYQPVKLGLVASGADVAGATKQQPEEWRALGINEWRARIGPCIVGILTVPLLALASVRMLGLRGAAILALLLAVSPLHQFWSQATRFYSLQFLFYNLALIWYFTSTEYGLRRLYVAAMLCVILAYMSQPPALFVGLVFAGDFVIGYLRRHPVRLTAFHWAVGLTALAVCVGLHMRDKVVAAPNWEQWGKLDGHSWKIIIAGTIYENHAAVVGTALLAGVGLYKVRPRLSSYLLMGAILPAIPVVIIALFEDAYSHTRYNFPIHFAWLALCAMGLDAIYEAVRPRFNWMVAHAATAALVGSLLLTDFFQLTQGYGLRQRWQEGFNYILDHRKPGDQISSERVLIAQYYLQTQDIPPFPNTPEQMRALTEPTWLILAAGSATKGRRHRWLDEEAQLKAYFDLRVVQPFSSVRVYYYDPSSAERVE